MLSTKTIMVKINYQKLSKQEMSLKFLKAPQNIPCPKKVLDEEKLSAFI